MAETRFTSDDKLLKIIEKSASLRKAGDKAIPLIGGKEHSLLRSSFFSRQNLKSSFTLGMLNKVLAGVCIVSTFLWAFDFISDSAVLDKRIKKMQALVPAEEKKAFYPALEKPVNLSEILYEAENRNMFSLLSPKAVAQAAEEVDYSAAIKDLRLVGILWSDSPQAMVEDVKEGKTYLLSNNDNLGEFKVKRILKENIFIGKGSLEWELR